MSGGLIVHKQPIQYKQALTDNHIITGLITKPQVHTDSITFRKYFNTEYEILVNL